MKIELREDGLCLFLEEESDWQIFDLLLQDASGRDPDWLAKRLGVLIDDEDWDEYVVPELSAHFLSQKQRVREALQIAEQEREGNEGQLFIANSDGEAWYGLVNQARLAVEGRWKIAALEDNEGALKNPHGGSEEQLAAYMRNRFYLFLQYHLMEIAFD